MVCGIDVVEEKQVGGLGTGDERGADVEDKGFSGGGGFGGGGVGTVGGAEEKKTGGAEWGAGEEGSIT